MPRVKDFHIFEHISAPYSLSSYWKPRGIVGRTGMACWADWLLEHAVGSLASVRGCEPKSRLAIGEAIGSACI